MAFELLAGRGTACEPEGAEVGLQGGVAMQSEGGLQPVVGQVTTCEAHRLSSDQGFVSGEGGLGRTPLGTSTDDQCVSWERVRSGKPWGHTS